MSELEIVRFNKSNKVHTFSLNILSLFKYFTIWILFLDILYLGQIIRNIEFFLVFIHLFIIFLCIQIFYFKVKEFHTYTYSTEFIFKGKMLMLIDFIFHYVPLIVILVYISKNSKSIKPTQESIFMLLFLPIVYCISFNTSKIYQIDKNEVFIQYLIYLTLLGLIYVGRTNLN